jgi:glutathione S-transferase
LDYHEERHIQGVHRIVARRAGGGVTVPVLVTPGRVVAESEAIVRYADESLPEQERLFPDDARLARDVGETSRWLDEGLGPDGRRLMYANMLEHRRLMLEVNNQGVPAWERRMLTALWPAMIRLGKQALAIAPGGESQDEERVDRAFDAVAERLADGRPYLCGERFTAADLTFASLSAAVVVPQGYGVSLPQPEILPPAIAATVRRYRAHPAGRFALRLFREERHRRER